MKILLVGNGKTAQGCSIDDFDFVCRFNNFQMQGFDVGTKFNAHCRRSCDDIQLFNPERLDAVYNFITYCPLSGGMKAVASRVHSHYKAKYIEVGLEECKSIAEDVGLIPMTERASVGILAICHFIKFHSPVYICGFDSVVTDKEVHLEHYYPRKPLDSQHHNWYKEAEYIKGLVKEGVVRCIIP